MYHGLQTGSSDEDAVCQSVLLSVCLSNTWIVTNERKICLDFFMPYERSFTLVLWQEEWLMGRPLLSEILGQPAAITPKRYEMGCQWLLLLLLITNRNSHTGFRLIHISWLWMTFNSVMAFIFFTELLRWPVTSQWLKIDVQGGSQKKYAVVLWQQLIFLATLYNFRIILFPCFSFSLLAITNPPCSAVSLRLLSYLFHICTGKLYMCLTRLLYRLQKLGVCSVGLCTYK